MLGKRHSVHRPSEESEELEEVIDLEQEQASVTKGEEKAFVKGDEPEEEDEEPITLVEDSEMDSLGDVRAFGAAKRMGVDHKADFQRTLNKTGEGATRCRIFHSKLAGTSIEYMEKQINDWIDADPEIEVKHVGHVIGTMLGKTPEPNLIVTIWY